MVLFFFLSFDDFEFHISIWFCSRGLFIVFDGLDRVGKTTQVSLLVDQLSEAGLKVRSYRFPSMNLFSRFSGSSIF